MPIHIKNNNKTEAVLASLAALLEKLREEKRKTHVPIKGLAISPLRCHKDAIVLDEAVLALERLQSLPINSLQFVQCLVKTQQLFRNSSVLNTYPLPDFRSVMDPKILMYADIDRQLSRLARKSSNLYHRGHHVAADAANGLIFDLRELNHFYFEAKQLDATHYQFLALMCIEDYQPELAQHRGCKKIVGNLSLLIFTLGIAFIVNKCVSGRYLFFQKTDSVKQLDEISQAVNSAVGLSI